MQTIAKIKKVSNGVVFTILRDAKGNVWHKYKRDKGYQKVKGDITLSKVAEALPNNCGFKWCNGDYRKL